MINSKLISEDEFLQKYLIDQADFLKTNLKWSQLNEIYNDYVAFRDEVEPSAIFIFNTIMKSPKVHSIRYRVKDPEHLIEKIIRKKIADSNSDITLENYKEVVTDLIGLRALHLFKEDWEHVNDFICKMWSLKETPKANFRKGDSEEIINFFKEKGCIPHEHKYGYRSVHYIIETQPAKTKYYAEIQVRTIFEEAWAEIDHTVRYPYDLDNQIFSQFLLILNRLAGSADEMGSFICSLKLHLSQKEFEFLGQLEEKNNIINNLEEKLEKTNLQGEELISVREDLNKLKKSQFVTSLFNPTDGISSLPDFTKHLNKSFNSAMTASDFNKVLNHIKNSNPLIFQSKAADGVNLILQAAQSSSPIDPLIKMATANPSKQKILKNDTLKKVPTPLGNAQQVKISTQSNASSPEISEKVITRNEVTEKTSKAKSKTNTKITKSRTGSSSKKNS